MAKALRTAALVVGAVALVATGVGALAGAGALGAAAAGTAGTVAGVSTATIAAVGTYASLAAGALSLGAAAAMPGQSVQGSATTFATNPQSGLPYAMGRTRMSGLRFFAATNSRPGYTKFNDLLWFGALLSVGGAIDSIESFKADGVAVTFDGGGNAVGTYRDYMGQALHAGGPQSAAVNLSLGGGTAPGWTAQHRLSGVTHAMWCLRFNKEGDMYGAGAPEPAWIGKWVRVYDPRLDSTYPGGSGPCRALDESTYVWSQNPGLHGLTWALGRWQNGKRVCGIGAPIANIRVAEFVECANICDANGWKVGGVEWTTDTKLATLKRILQAGGARFTKSRGMIGCLVSAPRTAIATIKSRHLLDKLQLNVTKSRRDRYNTVIPRYVDEKSDWAVVSGSAVQVAAYVAADRGQRTKEIDYPLVQVFAGEEAKQPAELAAYDIVNSREGGPFTWSTGPEWIGIKTGDVINLNVPEEGLVNQPMLVTKATPDPATGKINFAGETETHSKHDFALGRTTTPPAPFTLTAPDLKPPPPAAAGWAVTGATTGEGLPAIIVIGTSEMPSADAILLEYRRAGDEAWSRPAILSATGQILHVISPLESTTVYEVRVGYRVGSIDGDYAVIGTVTTGSGRLTRIGNDVGQIKNDIGIVKADLNILTPNVFDLSQLLGTYNAIMQARTTLEGMPVGTVVTNVRTVADSAVEDLKLLGARNAAGTAWNLALDTVYVGGGKTLAQRFTEVEVKAANDLGAKVTELSQAIVDGNQASALRLNTVEATLNGTGGQPGLTASVAQLMQAAVDTNGNVLAKYVLALKANGRVGGIVGTNNGTLARLDFDFDEVRFFLPDGSVMLTIGPNSEVYAPKLRVGKLLTGAMDEEFIANQDWAADEVTQEFPGGLIIKTGKYRAQINNETQFSIVFRDPFPTVCVSLVPVPYLATFSIYRDLWLQRVGEPSRFGATVGTQSSTGDDQRLDGFDWIAFGR